YKDEYKESGCFESQASGAGITASAKKLVQTTTGYSGSLKNTEINTKAVFEAYNLGDPLAQKVIVHAIELWAMASANLVSLFNPQKIIFGGGVFGPAVTFIPEIEKEARKWAQPVSINQVHFQASSLGSRSALYGAARLAIEKVKPSLLYA
ncbi:MAG TPA: ROK family protein, partial [Chitinophagaceae bacterium]